MALQKTIATVHGFEAINAYHRVEGVLLVGKNEIKFHIRSYKTPSDPFFKENIVTSVYDIEGKNPIKQAYEYLKTTQDFSGATDC